MDESAIVAEIGEEIVASCSVIPAGLARDIGIYGAGSAVGGGAGLVAAADQVAKRRKDRVTPGGHNGDMIAAVGRTQVAFFEIKRGLLRKSVGKLLAKSPRSEVAECSFEPSKMGASNLTVELADGTVYALQVARVHRGKGQALYEALTA